MPPDRATLAVLVSALLIASASFAVAGQTGETPAGNDTDVGEETPAENETGVGDETPAGNDTDVGEETPAVTDGDDNATEDDGVGTGENVTDDNVTNGDVTDDNVTDDNETEEEPATPGEAAADRPSLTIGSLSAPEVVSPGDTVTVDAVIENHDDERVSESVEFRLEGQVIDREQVTLGPEETANVTFTANTSGLGTGEFTHGVYTEQDGVEATLNVTEPFTVEDLSAPETAASGDEITVEATVTNPGDTNATERVTYRFSGGTIAEENVTLDPGESETITENVTLTGVAEGTYVHGVLARDNGQLAEIEVTDGNVSQANATVTFSDQETNGSYVVVDEVTVPNGGYVAIHDDSLLMGEVTGSVVGVSEKLEPGTHEDVMVHLYDFPGSPDNETLEEDQSLIAMPHLDDNGNGFFDFVRTNGEADAPYFVDGAVVVDSANVTISDNATAPTETDDEADPGVGETPTDGETPGETTPDGESPGETTPDGEAPGADTPGDETPGTDTPDGTNGTDGAPTPA